MRLKGLLTELVPLGASDLEWLAELINEPSVARDVFGNLEFPQSAADCATFVDRSSGAQYYKIVISSSGDIGGAFGVNYAPPLYKLHRACRYSLMIKPVFQGQGLGFDARVAVTHRLFSQMNVHRIIGGYLRGNARSERQAERIGAVPCGIQRSAAFFDGAFHDLQAWTLAPEQFYAACGEYIARMDEAPSA